jgi:hypothetical protein
MQKKVSTMDVLVASAIDGFRSITATLHSAASPYTNKTTYKIDGATCGGDKEVCMYLLLVQPLIRFSNLRTLPLHELSDFCYLECY